MRMTFTIPEPLARDIQSLIPPGERSSLVSRLLEKELIQRREELIRACRESSADKEVEKAIDDWQGFDEKIEGPEW